MLLLLLCLAVAVLTQHGRLLFSFAVRVRVWLTFSGSREGSLRPSCADHTAVAAVAAVAVNVADVDAPNPDVSRNHDVYRFCREWSCFEGQANVKSMVRSSPHCWLRFCLGVAQKF
jgi:hypothetical protein